MIIRCVVGRFSYSPQAEHLLSSFVAWRGDSFTRPRLESLVVIWHMVGRFSYSPQAGHLSSSFGAWWGDSLTRPRLDISGRPSARGGEIFLLAPGWTSPVVLRRVVWRFSHSPQAGHLRSSFGAWWGDSLTRPRLDMSCRRSACDERR